MKTAIRVAVNSLVGLVVFGLLIFWPAGTFDYWQAWVFIAVFTISRIVPTIYLLVTDPSALQRRMHGGPRSETRTTERIITAIALPYVPAMMVISVLDHRFGWSRVPTVSLPGDVHVLGNHSAAGGHSLLPSAPTGHSPW